MDASTHLTQRQLVWLDADQPLGLPAHTQLSQLGWDVQVFDRLQSAVAALPRAQAVVLRLSGSVARLTQLIPSMQAAGLNVPLIARVDAVDMTLAAAALNQGASYVVASDDFSAATWDKALLAEPMAVAPAAQRSVVFVDEASRNLFELARRVGVAEVTALLVGPTGAGKEVLARVLHESSPRARGPFVAVNCAALPEALIEDLLFGHEKGAYTGAHKETKGLFEHAQGGTIFLDEIGDMPIGLQAKLLRVLQERELVRLGGHTAIPLDVRVVAATNKDLRQAIERREFREDLYYRVSTFRLNLLPLAQRPKDILPLASQFFAQYGASGVAYQMTLPAQQALLAYHWPGNVRELENVIQRAVVLSADGVIRTEHWMFDDTPVPHVSMAFTSAPSAPAVTAAPVMASAPASDDLQSAVRSNEHQIIMAAINSTATRSDAAKKLGISPRTLRYKIAQLRERGLAVAGV
jgi:two-component system, response regulator FlrC